MGRRITFRIAALIFRYLAPLSVWLINTIKKIRKNSGRADGRPVTQPLRPRARSERNVCALLSEQSPPKNSKESLAFKLKTFNFRVVLDQTGNLGSVPISGRRNFLRAKVVLIAKLEPPESHDYRPLIRLMAILIGPDNRV